MSTIAPPFPNSWDAAALAPSISLHVSNIKHLGVHISPRLSELAILDFKPLFKTIEDNLYHFSMIPIKPPPLWLKSLDSIISKFYWKNKSPRINFT